MNSRLSESVAIPRAGLPIIQVFPLKSPRHAFEKRYQQQEGLFVSDQNFG